MGIWSDETWACIALKFLFELADLSQIQQMESAGAQPGDSPLLVTSANVCTFHMNRDISSAHHLTSEKVKPRPEATFDRLTWKSSIQRVTHWSLQIQLIQSLSVAILRQLIDCFSGILYFFFRGAIMGRKGRKWGLFAGSNISRWRPKRRITVSFTN